MAGLIKRGQIWIADLNPGFGFEVHKKRPVLIIANDKINQNLNTTIVIPISSQVHPLGPEKVLITKGTTGLDKDSVVLTVFVRAIDKARLIKKIGRVKREELLEVEDSLKLILGFSELTNNS